MMAPHIRIQKPKMRRNTVILLLVALSAGIFYAWYLHHENARGARYMETLRETEPEHYLTNLRKLRGFGEYVLEYRRFASFETYRPAAPEFVIGRWSLHRVTAETTATGNQGDCTDPITFEYGRLALGDESLALKAEYRLDAQTLNSQFMRVRTKTGQMSVRLVSYGAAIDHLELIPPYRTALYYAYPCF